MIKHITIITTPSEEYSWIAKTSEEVKHFSQPGQGHSVDDYISKADAYEFVKEALFSAYLLGQNYQEEYTRSGGFIMNKFSEMYRGLVEKVDLYFEFG